MEKPFTDYQKLSKKVKVHLGFNVTYGIPSKIFLTDEKKLKRLICQQNTLTWPNRDRRIRLPKT